MRFFALLGVAVAVGTATDASPSAALWTFPAIILAAFILSWGAEAAQFLMAQGLALAILAGLQTMPEFAVEATIAWKAATRPVEFIQVPGQPLHVIHNNENVVANFTGANRLLVGLGLPLIYFTHAFFSRRRTGVRFSPIVFDRAHAIEVMGLLPGPIYFAAIYVHGYLCVLDAAALVALYGVYVAVLNRLPPEEAEKIEDMDWVPRTILRQPPPLRLFLILAIFAAGGATLYGVAEPFVESMLALAIAIGVPTMVFIQWVAPFLSEFPEKVSAFNWARTVSKSPLGVMNMVSSSIMEWTLLVALVPVVYTIGIGGLDWGMNRIHFSDTQRMEILLTMAQSFLCFFFLADMRLTWWEALGLLALWVTQLVVPHWREEVTIAYAVWVLLELGMFIARPRSLRAVTTFGEIWREIRAGKVRRSPSL